MIWDSIHQPFKVKVKKIKRRKIREIKYIRFEVKIIFFIYLIIILQNRGMFAHGQLHVGPSLSLNTNSKLEDQQIRHSTFLYLSTYW